MWLGLASFACMRFLPLATGLPSRLCGGKDLGALSSSSVQGHLFIVAVLLEKGWGEAALPDGGPWQGKGGGVMCGGQAWCRRFHEGISPAKKPSWGSSKWREEGRCLRLAQRLLHFISAAGHGAPGFTLPAGIVFLYG